jgi:ketosteroid isomerase-like protein
VTEALIRQRIEELTSALRAKDIERVMTHYASDIVSFDVGPPLRYSGAHNKQRAWREALGAFAGPIGYDVRELRITVKDDLALAHSLNHVRGTSASGRSVGLWLRWTACLRHIDGVWLIVHDHVSVPVDLERGHALLDLTP